MGSHEGKEKFECGDCGCYYWVDDRNDFDCPNCEDKEDHIRETELWENQIKVKDEMKGGNI